MTGPLEGPEKNHDHSQQPLAKAVWLFHGTCRDTCMFNLSGLWLVDRSTLSGVLLNQTSSAPSIEYFSKCKPQKRSIAHMAGSYKSAQCQGPRVKVMLP